MIPTLSEHPHTTPRTNQDDEMTKQPAEQWIPEETFGDRIRRVRRSLKLSQGDFAARIDEGEKAVGSWEAGIREPRSAVAIAKRIELAFGVPAAWVLGLDVPAPTPPTQPGDAPVTSIVPKHSVLRAA